MEQHVEAAGAEVEDFSPETGGLVQVHFHLFFRRFFRCFRGPFRGLLNNLFFFCFSQGFFGSGQGQQLDVEVDLHPEKVAVLEALDLAGVPDGDGPGARGDVQDFGGKVVLGVAFPPEAHGHLFARLQAVEEPGIFSQHRHHLDSALVALDHEPRGVSFLLALFRPGHQGLAWLQLPGGAHQLVRCQAIEPQEGADVSDLAQQGIGGIALGQGLGVLAHVPVEHVHRGEQLQRALHFSLVGDLQEGLDLIDA